MRPLDTYVQDGCEIRGNFLADLLDVEGGTVTHTNVLVTAVLDRTAVIEPSPGEPKVLVRRNRILADEDDIEFVPTGTWALRFKGNPPARVA